MYLISIFSNCFLNIIRSVPFSVFFFISLKPSYIRFIRFLPLVLMIRNVTSYVSSYRSTCSYGCPQYLNIFFAIFGCHLSLLYRMHNIPLIDQSNLSACLHSSISQWLISAPDKLLTLCVCFYINYITSILC